ncbi:hypothetical protein [Kaistella montana]|uniref:Uncharacterized protein n=1 Tax=Kaistella montana TaxID=1849733 RepID=A0ABW5KAK0_9FLAO|nr:hypothetical protein [Kaistella montana]MCQ4035083.1 hypothetical protein [Kaistella montana]
MASIITGLFESQSQSKKISEDLVREGFSDSDFIIYLHQEPISKEIKTSIWQSFFKDDTRLEDESLAVSVKANTPESKEKILQIFQDNNSIHTNYFENIKFSDAQSLQYLKRIVALRAKSEIYSSPLLKHHIQHEGMNTEVLFGKS